MRCRSQWTKDHLSPSSSVLCKCQHEAQPRSVDISTEERTIPVRHSRGPLGLTLTLALTLITPGMADPRNGGAGTERTNLHVTQDNIILYGQMKTSV